ncbi:methyltransferase N6AMT1-like [Thrips palmi]|uniref:Methyltransferase HEMK2 n=1 Tax=Thrips palmi TaxID=161013 RepID=A0A6P9A804_THRPL|nr:methyltransferase N6AMT1-like [Thrips palmi]
MKSRGEEVIETPDLSHLSVTDFDHVYEPREDSFLFLDALEKDLSLIHSLQPRLGLEVGSGSGVISTAVARALGSTCYMMATDINPFACKATQQTALKNKTNVACMQMDLDTMMRMDNSFDLLLFNPPYCVTSKDELSQPEEGGSFLHLAWAGGIQGREVTDRLLHHVGKLLSPKALFYLVVIKENDPEEIMNVLSHQGFQGHTIASRKVKNECLSILRFCRGF